MVNDPLVLRGSSKTCVPVVQFGKDIRVNYCAGGMNVSIAVANSQAIYDFSSYKDRSLAKFTPAGSSSRCRLNKCSRGGRTAFPIGLDHRRALHIENPGSQRYSTTPALKLQRLAPSIGPTWQPNGLPALYSSVVCVCSADSPEKILLRAASRHGCSTRHRLCFVLFNSINACG